MIDQAAAVVDLTSASIEAKIERVRAAAAAGRPTPRLQFNCYRFGITYWHLGPDVDAVSRIVERLRSG